MLDCLLQEVFDGSSILFGDWLRQEVPADARVYEQVGSDRGPTPRHLPNMRGEGLKQCLHDESVVPDP